MKVIIPLIAKLKKDLARISKVQSWSNGGSLITSNIVASIKNDGTFETNGRILQGGVANDGTTGIIAESLKVEGAFTTNTVDIRVGFSDAVNASLWFHNDLSGSLERAWNIQGNSLDGLDFHFYNGSSWSKKVAFGSDGSIYSNTEKIATEAYVTANAGGSAKKSFQATFGQKYAYNGGSFLPFELNDTGTVQMRVPFDAKIAGWSVSCSTASSVDGEISMHNVTAGGYPWIGTIAATEATASDDGAKYGQLTLVSKGDVLEVKINNTVGMVSPVVVLYFQEV